MMNMQMQKNCGCRTGNIREKVRELSFALYETVLYLDAYPSDTVALEYYNTLLGELEEATETYEKKYGPLTMYGNNASRWSWIESPWPWESEAN